MAPTTFSDSNSHFSVHPCISPFKSTPLFSAWHPLLPYFAVATPNGVVTIYNEEGEKLDASMSRTNNPNVCHWHPEEPTLLTGWKDGAILIFNLNDTGKKSKEIQSETGSIISALKWCPDGERFVSSDANGTVSIWKQNESGKYTIIQDYKCDEKIVTFDFKLTKISESFATEQKDWIFFFVGELGGVYVADDVGHMRSAFNMKDPIAALLQYVEKSTFAVLTYTSILSLYEIDDDLKIKQTMRSKINVSTGGNCPTLTALWVGRGIMATCANETLIRVWNLDTDDSYQLTTSDIRDPITNIAFNPRKRVLSGITSNGTIYNWQFSGSDSNSNADEDWELVSRFSVDKSSVHQLSWGPGDDLLSVCTDEGAIILRETTLKSKMKGKVVAIQTSANQISVEKIATSGQQNRIPLQVKAGINIRELDLSENHIALSNGKQVEIYVMKEGIQSFTAMDPITVASTCIGMHRENLFVCTSNRIEIYNFNGTKKQTITFTPKEGDPSCISIFEDNIAVGTTAGQLKLFQMTGRDARAVGSSKTVFEDGKRIITNVSINCTGQKVSILSKDVHKSGILQPSTFLTVFDVNLDKIIEFDFFQYGRHPLSHFWDEIEPKMLTVEARRFSSISSSESKLQSRVNDNGRAVEIFTLFATPDDGLLKQDSFSPDRNIVSLVGTSVPTLYFTAKNDDSSQSSIFCKSMRDFEGINVQDNVTRDALLNFSYFLTIGLVEEAYKSVKTIKDVNVWQNIAQMCVKTKKMEVAEICLSKMQNVRASKALREAKREPELEAQVAMLAIQLGMIEEAEKLYESCGRYDLLTNLYQALGEWDKALQTCQKYDRIHLKTMHYQYAKYLEQVGELQEAMRHYELSKNDKYEIPRMLYQANKIQLLQQFILQKNEPDLHRWWAQFREGEGDYENAFNFYMKAKDYLSLVRMSCFVKQYDQAAEIVNASGDRAAAFHLGRQLEAKGDIDGAIKYYKIAKRFRHALNVAIQNDQHQEVWNIAIDAPSVVKLEAAQYFEGKNMKDKSVLLYQKAGYLSKAIDLCFKSELFDVLSEIAESLDDSADPSILIRCGEFFTQHRRYEKAVMMFVNARETDMAIELCQRHNVLINEYMANKMIPLKSEDPTASQNRDRALLQIAQICESQGSYHIATKLYVQAGDKAKAMRVLIKSGDTQKIIYFAVLSRKKDLYILAANYLQTLEWQNNSELTSSITSFYKKAKAWDKLSLFYEACSLVEIDEYRDYEKALDALKDAVKYLAKSTRDVRSKSVELNSKIETVERFIELQKNIQTTDSVNFERSCRELARDVQFSEAIRLGDIFALLAEHYYTVDDKSRAYNILVEMKDQKIELSYYLSHSMLKDIALHMNIPLSDLEDAPRVHEEEPVDPMYDPNHISDDEGGFQEEYLDDDDM